MIRSLTRCLAFAGAIAAVSPLGACDRPANTGAILKPASHTHAVRGETCLLCDPAKRDPARLWCGEHTRYEDRCWLCHPELRDRARPYCDEHGLYEDECPLCNPSLRATPGASDHAGHGHAHDGSDALHCAEHNLAERECAVCHPELAAGLAPGESLKIRFASAESTRKAGVETVPARAGEAATTLHAFAETRLNANRVARITPLASGVLTGVLADLGDRVEFGEALLEIHSVDVATAGAEYLTSSVALKVALESLKRRESLHAQSLASESDLAEAQAAARLAHIAAAAARGRLRSLGLREDDVAARDMSLDADATLVLRAPFAGEIVERTGVVGQPVAPGDAPLVLADLTTMWVELLLPPDSPVQPGMLADVRFDSLPGVSTQAEIVWVDAVVDPRSRMVRARAVADNADRRLRAGLFGEATITTSSARPVLQTPRSAVQDIDGVPFVFVREGADLFAARRVTIAALDDRVASIASGLAPGEPVVVTGAFTVLSEMLKSRLGAGCVHE